MSKGMKIVFVVSLVLNALLLGLVAGQALQKHRMKPLHRANEIRPEMRGNVNKERRTLFVIMAQPNFDRAAFQVQLNRYSDAYCDFNKKFMIDLNDRLQQLPPAERARVLHNMTQRKFPR